MSPTPMGLFRANGNKQLREIELFHRYQLCFLFLCCALIHAGCGPVIENTLRSPGYPNDNPKNTDCISSVPVPQGMAINITINELYLENSISCE